MRELTAKTRLSRFRIPVVSMPVSDWTTSKRTTTVIDAIAVYDLKQLSHHRDRAQSFTSETGHEPFVSSYAHVRGTVGEAYVTFTKARERGGVVRR